VSVAADDLRGDVFFRADERVGSFAVGETRFSPTHRADSRGLRLLESVFVVVMVSPVRREEGDPPGEIPAVFPARFGNVRIGQGDRRNLWIRFRFGIEFAGEVKIGEGDVAGVLDEDIFGF